MPNCTIEYARELESKLAPETLLDEVFQGLVTSGLFDVANINVRLIPFDHYQSAGGKRPFIHVTVKVFPGRSLEQKKGLSECVAERLRNVAYPPTLLTVEILELEKESYSRVQL